MESSELIRLLEAEMAEDIQSIDISVEQESQITIHDVREWYCEAEKLVRVLRNILTVPMSQSINQLRYAGHHVLKAQTNETVAKPNLLEAFKHCKRAVYDALDFYVYKLNERYRVFMPHLDSQKAVKLERVLNNHIKKIQTCRVGNGDRISYYQDIQNTLIEGLQLIEDINEIQRETGIAKELYAKKKSLIDENSRLEERLNTLQNTNKRLEGRMAGRSYWFSIALAIALALATPIGLILADAYIVNKHEIQLPIPPTSTPAISK